MRIKKLFYKIIFITLLLVYSPLSFSAKILNENYLAQKIVSGLGIPWGMTFLSENELLITEKEGRLTLVTLGAPNKMQSANITGLPKIMQVGQGGLLDVKVEPNSLLTGVSPQVYFTYVAESTASVSQGLPTLMLARANLVGDRLENWQVLFEANNAQNGSRHFGSRIAFDEQGHVFFSMGDRGQRNNSQDLSLHSGSIFRLYLDGSVPSDNPFVGKDKHMPEIWSYGHRNPQGLAFDFETKRLWSIEHGPRGGDEINLIGKGNNYGWPVISYGREYVSNLKVSKDTHREGMEQPVHYYIPSIAPSSLMIYSGKKFAQFKRGLFSGALKLKHLNLVNVDRSLKVIQEQRLLVKLAARIRNVVESPDGDIYFSTDNGSIFRIIETQ